MAPMEPAKSNAHNHADCTRISARASDITIETYPSHEHQRPDEELANLMSVG
jgi:hypothetical protein